MYIPKNFEETDVSIIHSLIKAHPFATWVCTCEGELNANHIPFVLDTSCGKHGVLKGHVARANSVWKTIASNSQSLVIFQGAESYITPSWYPSKQEHGKVVPTWNYAVVHVKGSIKIVDDKKWLLEHLNELSDEQEVKQPSPWKVSDAPKDFIDPLLNSIVGLELLIENVEGKWKFSQNKPEKDKLGVIAGLEAKNETGSIDMAEFLKGKLRN